MTRNVQRWAPLRLGSAALRLLSVALALPFAGADVMGQGPAGYSLLDEEPGEHTFRCRVVADKGWTDDSDLRIAFDVRDAGDFAYVRVRRGKAALFRQDNAGDQAMGEPKPFQPPASWEAFLQRREGRIRFIADGRVLLDEAWDRPLGGRTGTLASGGARIEDPLVQPYEPPLLLDDFTREAGEMGGWTVHAPDWRNTLVRAPKAEPSRSANPFTIRAETAGEAFISTGDWFWDSYRTSVSVKPLDAAAVGIAAYVQDGSNMVQFRWQAGSADAPQARQLVLVRDGKVTVLASDQGGFAPDQWYQLALRVGPGAIEAFVDRYPVLSAETAAFGQGGVGLWCQQGSAAFDDMLAASADSPELGLPRINPVFVADEVMQGNELYTPAGQWRAGEGGAYWNWGEYFDDVELRIPASALSAEPVSVLLRATSAEDAYSVALSRNGATLSATLTRPPDTASSGSAEVTDDDAIAVSVAGATVSVRCRGQEVARLADPAPLTGRKLGLKGPLEKIVQAATVVSGHSLDYAFDAAPTDWFGGKGIWQITTRWPCQPGWTFFGGTHQENPVLWTKHAYSGDIVLEFFANLQMDRPPPPGYSRPSDINAALCADGAELDSGYAFVFAGWNNTKTAILRRGEIVAETGDAVFVNPTSSNAAFHRHWFRVRAERIGNQVALWVDGRRVLAYEDPAPLAHGRAAVWSFHNGIMIGRARLWFAEEQPGGVVPSRVAVTENPEPGVRAAEGPIQNDFEADIGEWQTFATPAVVGLGVDGETAAGGKCSLRLTNLVSGGSFGVYAVVTPFRATECPELSFDYRIPAGVQVNLYVYANRQWHAIQLCAEEPESASTPLLGRVEGVECDDRWHHARFDLLSPLAALYPELKTFTVKYVALAAPEESYVRCGIGGNHRGATYWVDSFRIGAATP